MEKYSFSKPLWVYPKKKDIAYFHQNHEIKGLKLSHAPSMSQEVFSIKIFRVYSEQDKILTD